MEQQRLHILEWTDRHRRIEFNPRPVPPTAASATSTPPKSKRGAKLDPEAVRAIREGLAAREPVADIAARHGVSKVTVNSIRRGESWTDVE